MARSHARFELSLFSADRDGDLASLSAEAKLLYVVIVTDPAVNYAGVVLLRPGVWQEEASLDDERMDKAFAELERGRFTVVDRRTCELLVRSFMRSDKVDKQPNVLKGALAQALHTRSRVLRKALADECRRMAPKRPDGKDKLGRLVVYPDPHATADVLDPDGGPTTGPPNPSGNPSPNPSWNPSGIPSEGIGGGTLPGTLPGTPGGRGRGRGGGEGSCSVGTSVSSDTDASDTVPTPKRTRTAAEPEGFAEWYAAFPRHEARVKAAAAYRAALRKRGVTVEVLLDGAHRYARLVETECRDRSKILLPPSWLNGERWNDELPSGAGRDPMAVPDGQLSDEDVDEILGPGMPPEPPDEFEFWPRDRRHEWNRENIRRWRQERRERAIRVRAERLARVTRLDDRRRDVV
jgi:hypothetical protein